jgi:hypothetical protein
MGKASATASMNQNRAERALLALTHTIFEGVYVARETITRLVDDLDGSPADVSVEFGLDGLSYTIDLNTKHEKSSAPSCSPTAMSLTGSSTREGRDGRVAPE